MAGGSESGALTATDQTFIPADRETVCPAESLTTKFIWKKPALVGVPASTVGNPLPAASARPSGSAEAGATFQVKGAVPPRNSTVSSGPLVYGTPIDPSKMLTPFGNV